MGHETIGSVTSTDGWLTQEVTVPDIENPYPQIEWSRITEFRYETPLWLYRAANASELRGDSDDADYVVARPYSVTFNLDGETRRITVPQGMLTDLASVPSIARAVVGRVGPHLEASIVHDFLYIAWQDIENYDARAEDRDFADKLFRVAMIAAKVGRIRRFLIYHAVRTFGGSAFSGTNPPPRYVPVPGP